MSANETQVGGTHYKVGDKPEHWDLATMYQWDPFQYQITKYVMRWKSKHATHEKRLEDLKKARHFLDKYIEEADQWDHWTEEEKSPKITNLVFPESAKSGILLVDNPDWTCEGYYGDMTQLYKCRKCGTSVKATTFQAASILHGECPGKDYVNQG